MQIVVDGILTHYELLNPKAKTPLVILHGWGHNASLWLPLTKLLASDCRVYLLDLPGFGGTHNLAQDADVPHYTEFVHHFTVKLKLRNFILVGHSFGGQIATDFALKYPNVLRRLVLIDSATIRVRRLKTRAKIFLAKVTKPLTQILPATLKRALLSLYTSPDYANANSYLKGVLDQILKYDLSKKIHTLKVPTDIIWGSEDRVIPYTAKLLVETIENADLHVIYGAGHSPHLTHTAKLAVVLNQIIENEPA